MGGYGWWVQPTFQSIFDVISCVCSPVNVIDNYTLNDLGILLFTSLGVLLTFYIVLVYLKKEERKAISLGFGGIFVLIATMSFAAVFSYLIKPMFYQRYAVICLGCLWLSFSIILSKTYQKKIIFVPILIVILLIGITNSISFINSQNTLETSYTDFAQCLTQINENDTIITLGSYLLTKFYLNKNQVIMWSINHFSMIPNGELIKMIMNPGILSTINSSIISEIEKTSTGQNIWVFNQGVGIYDFNKTITEDYDLELVKKIEPMSNSYSYEVYLLKHKS